MEKQYIKPTLDKVEWKLTDVILYSPPQQETYEVPIRKRMQEDLVGTGDLGPQDPTEEPGS